MGVYDQEVFKSKLRCLFRDAVPIEFSERNENM